MTESRSLRVQVAVGAALSLGILFLALQPWRELELSLIEAVAVISYAWSGWLLACNNPLGWWVGLIGVARRCPLDPLDFRSGSCNMNS